MIVESSFFHLHAESVDIQLAFIPISCSRERELSSLGDSINEKSRKHSAPVQYSNIGPDLANALFGRD